MYFSKGSLKIKFSNALKKKPFHHMNLNQSDQKISCTVMMTFFLLIFQIIDAERAAL
jgi:hypothetical protein